MNRRDFLRTAGMWSAAAVALPKARALFAEAADNKFGAPPVGYRTFEVTAEVEVLKPSGLTRIWVPSGLITETPYQKTLGNYFLAPGGKAQISDSKADALGLPLRMIAAEFPAGVKPALTVTTRVATRDWGVDLSAPAKPAKASRSELAAYLRPTKLLPTGGLVKQKATEITSGAKTDLDKARAIYDWIVDNTVRDAAVRGCGLGDIETMLASGDLRGKCADINALYVGLARAAGLPARDVYGIRVAPSKLGYKSLGTSSETITKSQHCRAEVYISALGWVPVDPADVRKVMLEEPPGNRPGDDPMVSKARTRLFGSWEMNWIAYNFTHDVALPGSKGQPVGFLMYPQAETDGGRLDSLDADAFKYSITSKELRSPNI